MHEILRVDSLKKHYGHFAAVKSISFRVNRGAVFGLLGPNGSGKTTLLGCISGILLPTAGSFSWFEGISFEDARKRTGSLIETPNFYPYLSAYENLKIAAAVKGVSVSDIHRVLAETGLGERKNDAVRKFSLGMKQRLAIASALLGDPPVLILDEPTNGLDPEGINEIRDLILRQQKAGKTVILASHLLHEVEKVCTDVVILRKGELLRQGKVDEILSQSGFLQIAAHNAEALHDALGKSPNVESFTLHDAFYRVKLREGAGAAEINRELVNKGIDVTHLQTIKSDLESEFLKLIKK